MSNWSHFIPHNLIINTWEDIQPYFNKLLEFNIKNMIDLELFIKNYSDVLSVYREQDARAYIDMTRYTNNEAYVKRHEVFNTEISPKLQLLANEIDQKIVSHPEYQNLSKPRYNCFKRSLEQELKMFREENVELDAQLSQLGTKYAQITGALTAHFRGQDLPIPQAQVHLTKSDREVRREAWLAIQESRFKVKNELNTLFTEMIGLRHQVALNAGYKNYRDYKHDSLDRFDYSVEDVKNFHVAIKECITPLATEISKRRRDELKLPENDFRPWDQQGEPVGKEPLNPFKSGNELLEKSIAVFNRLHPEFGNNLVKMKNADLFDLESRKHKAPGGYNYSLEVTGMPFIFMNAAGMHRDMTTLMHEGGHAMHTFLSSNEPLVFYRDTPSEMAETASMSMELMTASLWTEFYNEHDLKRARREQLEDILSFFPWCAIVDKFQHWIYENPKNTSEQREEYFIKLTQEFSGNLINWNGYEHFRRSAWQKQLHIFEVPFYYIEYGIAQLGALQIYRNYVENPQKALEGYISGLKLGSSLPLPEVWNAMNIRFDFSVTMIRELMDFIQNELQKFLD